MARALRIESPGAIYHVTSRGAGKGDITDFRPDADVSSTLGAGKGDITDFRPDADVSSTLEIVGLAGSLA
ncbi:MAG: hypothetical protein U1E05_10595, partial [Patescibacteria group bacterium]|nr:hypothetical protein [Patescibacteria group bacterium]